MKKLILGFCMMLVGAYSQAQNGLENIVVEKYYVSNAADAAGSIGTLPVGSVTYRIYADMLPGYKFQAAYGVGGHSMTLSTTTTFFNNEDRGAISPTYTKAQAAKNSVMLDSWLSVGAACSGNFGILKSEDNVALGGATVVNTTAPTAILQNNDPSTGIALTVQDGLYAGAPEPVTTVGLTTADLGVFDATSQVGGLFTSSNGSWASLNGSTGPVPATNKVLIAQITTDGVFHYELNIQIGTPTGGVQNYVALNPTGSEISIPSLTGTLGAANIAPTVSITSPANGTGFITGSVVAIAATAADADGSVNSVDFYVDGTLLSSDNAAPYTANYTSVAGTHTLTAKATDNNGSVTTSTVVTINVANNPAPSVNITSPTAGATFVVADVVAIAANATDNGSVASVEFFVDGTSIGIDNTSPYTANYTAVLGSHSLTARATDNLGAQTTSAAVTINVVNNIPPTVSITAPVAGVNYTAPAVVIINASAADADGSVSQVDFYVNAVLVGTDATAPYSFSWTSVIGAANLTAKATDNRGAVTTSSTVAINIADPNALPYKVVSVTSTCNAGSFCVPVAAVDSVRNIIGYDVVMAYDKNKVTPTGIITVSSDLINPSYVDVINSIDAVNGLINISAYFNISAPATANFRGIGKIFCVEFNKTANYTSVDTAIISVPSLQESYYNGVTSKLADAGKTITYKDSIFNGKLKFMDLDIPVSYDVANPNAYLITNIYGNSSNCNSQSLTAVQPNVAGNFAYNINNGINLSIKKDIIATTDVQPVVNGFDALLARKVLLNDLSFIPTIYNMIAMDVNTDGVISAGDVSQINQRAVLMIPEFKQAWNYNSAGVSNGQLSKDWLFIDSSRVITDLAYRISATYPLNDGVGYSKSKVPVIPFCLPVPVTNTTDCPVIGTQVYRGVLLGDIDGNFATVSPSNNFRTDGNTKIVMDLSRAVIADGYVDIPVSINSLTDVNALDFAMKFNSDKLTYKSVLDITGKLDALAHYNNDDHTLRFTSSSISKYDVYQNILTIRFAIKADKVTENDFNTVSGYLNGERTTIEMKTGSDFNDIAVNIYPNPATSQYTIAVSENAHIQMTDVSGRLVIEDMFVAAGEKKEVNVLGLSSGMYMVKIKSATSSTIKKVVIK